MEEFQRQKQYEYRSTSNLVLTSENRRRESGPTGEVESLVGKKDVRDLIRDMGSRSSRSKPSENDMKKKRRREREEKTDEDHGSRRSRKMDTSSVLSTEVDQIYRPKSRDTKIAYEVLLNFIQQEMGGQPQDVLKSAADEVLAILKDDHITSHDRKKQVEELFRRAVPMESDRFSSLVNIGKSITDYSSDPSSSNTNALDEQGVSVVFEEDDEDQDSDLDEQAEDDDAEIDEKDEEEQETSGTLKQLETEEGDAMDVDEKESGLDAKKIDAFWLQRELSTFYRDAHTSQQMADQVYAILSDTRNDNRLCENKLVNLLEHDKFDFVKLLLLNRLKVVYCVKYARADDAEKKVLEEEMYTTPELRPIIEALTRTTSTAADRTKEKERSLMKEARSLKTSTKGSAAPVAPAAPAPTPGPQSALRPKSLVDLESIAFQQGGHLMSNTQCKVPEGTFRLDKKGYQEVHVPAWKRVQHNDNLVHISDMPQWAQEAFAGMRTLNVVQSRLYQTAMFTAENLLLCAPTGAGKTNVAMLTILRELGLHRNEDGTINKDAFKIIYVAPMKSLVREMVQNFSQRLEPYGIAVKELTGDQQLTKQQISETQIIVTTPEKWDIITRKSGDRTYTQFVRLLIIDEIHLLHDDRGPVLESIVSRTVRQIESTQEMIRLVGLSATLPNYEDVATFLRVDPAKGLYFFDKNFRPCPLQQVYIGVTEKKAFKRYQLMNEITFEKVVEQRNQNFQVLVFVHSRKDTASTAKILKDMAQAQDKLDQFVREESRSILAGEAENCKNPDLKDVLPFGFAIHHAGLSRRDRALVEDLFAAGHIQVLVSTATLAWGVNLPAHCVIIKGTQIYSPEKGKWIELSPQDVLQMLGRAGRPQYDEYGEGIIITSNSEVYYYLSLLNQQLPIESQFISRLADNLNAEVVLGSVQNVKEAVDWLGYTYLYVRMLRTPQLYGVPLSSVDDDPLLLQRRADLIHSAASVLDKTGLVKYDRKTGTFQVTDLGRIASHYYISHSSMAVFNDFLKPNMSDIEIFRVFSLSGEFKYMTVREEEKNELSKLLDKVPVPVKESIEEPSAKVNVLLQSYISRLKLEGFALVADMVFITQSAGRIMRALFEIALKRGWASVAEKTLNLCKMIDHRMWGCQSPLRQFKGVPLEVMKRIEQKDFPWERLYDLKPQEIGEFIRVPKMGKTVYTVVHQLPRLELTGHVQPITRSVLRVELSIQPDFQFDEKVHGETEPFWIMVQDVDGETILHHEYFILKRKFVSEAHAVSFTIPIYDPLPPQYYVHVISDRWIGSQTVLPISFRHLLLPEKFPPPTELLDLQPLPVIAIGQSPFVDNYRGFRFFNAIQTQTFNALFKTDDNVFLAAPTGSGKTICAEFAILRMLQQHPDGRCVYIGPLPAIARERFEDWTRRFQQTMDVRVVSLTGETTTDLKLLKEGQIVIATPEQWDIMSRRWRTRKDVQTVRLMIVDELHLIGGEVGPVLEVVVSRMRYIATQTESPTRLVALSASVANARDLGQWVGAPARAQFNFHPNTRPVPLSIHLQGFDIHHFDSRMLAMTKPTYVAISYQASNKPVIVFAPDRKHARRVAVDIMSFAASEDAPKKFLHLPEEDLEPHLVNVKNTALRETLMKGVAFYHEGLSETERQVVRRLFQAGAIQVVVAEASLAWGMDLSAYMVIIMGTQKYDGREHRHSDYPITDIIQMMGRACRPTQDDNSKCVVFCHTPQKEFLKKFLEEPFPVESHLDHYLADHMSAEIVTKRIETVQDAVDYLTWTFLYLRLTQNPNYYNLQGVSHRHLSDHLSELVEATLADLEQSKCISIEDETELAPLNLGMIAAYYYIKYTTVELFSSSLTAKTKRKALLEILANASEFDGVPVRHHEDKALQALARHLPLKITDPNYHDPHTKTNILLQAHFSRLGLTADVAADQQAVLPDAIRLLQAIVDVISSNGWLSPALAAMELSQMVTQAMWDSDSPLMQLPHFTKELAAKCKSEGVEGVFDLMDMEDNARNELLQLSASKMADIARFCNQYPNIELAFSVKNKNRIHVGSTATVQVHLERDLEEEEMAAAQRVFAQRYPKEKVEGWWLVLGDSKTNQLLSIKRVVVNRKEMDINLEFEATTAGKQNLMLYLMSDSYAGCDQEYEVKFNVAEASSRMEESDQSGSEEDE